MDYITLIQLFDSTVRLATPLLLACLAGLFSERAGIFDIGLDGKMLAAAFFSAAVASLTGNVWLGLLAGIAASMALSLLHGLASITFRGNQLISGVAINFLAAGLTVLIAQDWFQQGGRTPSLIGGARFNPITLPFADDNRPDPDHRPALCRVDLGPFDPCLPRLPRGSCDMVAAVPDTLWPASARCGRKPRSGGYRRGFRHRAALCCGADLWRALRYCRCLPQHGAAGRLHQGYVRRPWLYRAGGTDPLPSGARGTRCGPRCCSACSARWKPAPT